VLLPLAELWVQKAESEKQELEQVSVFIPPARRAERGRAGEAPLTGAPRPRGQPAAAAAPPPALLGRAGPVRGLPWPGRSKPAGELLSGLLAALLILKVGVGASET